MIDLKVLCVCLGNTCRSPMLEVLLKHELSERHLNIPVESAGVAVREAHFAFEHAITCMRERGLDLSSHRSRNVSEIELASFSHVFVMEPAIKAQIPLPTEDADRVLCPRSATGGVPNPWGKDLAVYRATCNSLAAIAEEIACIFNIHHLTGAEIVLSKLKNL